MANRKRDVSVERVSRNPCPSRQAKTTTGRPLFSVPFHFADIREALGISQGHLAMMAGVPKAAIANVETGRYSLAARVGVKIFMALARAASSPEHHEQRRQAIESARKLIVDQEELSRNLTIAFRNQIAVLQARLKNHKEIAAELEEAKEELGGFGASRSEP